MTGGIGGAAVAQIVRRRFVAWCVLGLALGVALGAIPLFGVLGLELAVVAAAFAAIAGLDLGAALARTVQRTPVRGIARATFAGRALAGTTLWASALAIAAALVPGLACAVRGLWVPTCDWTFGVVTYVALPLASAALAGALGHAIGALVGPRRWLCAALAQLPIVLLAAHGVWIFYSTPPVFTYSPIIGYFPGELYDEQVHLGAALAWSRLEQLAWVIAIVAAVATRLDVPEFRVRWRAPRPAGRRIGAIAIAVAAAACAIALRANSGALGFAIDADDIAAELGGRIETAHFVIFYAKTPEIEADIELIARDHEFRYKQVVDQLGVAPAGKLRSFYFRDGDQKARWFGARNVEMAKPWRHEIYIDHRPFPHESLRHEITHAVAAEFGDPIFGVATKRVLGVPIPLLVRPGLVEGLSVAVDWPGIPGAYTPHQAVHAMTRMGMTPTVDELMSLDFFTSSSPRGYTTAGSFVRFLLDRYGAPRLRAVYGNGGDFEAAYGESLDKLEDEWRGFIAQLALPHDAIEGQREHFRGGSVFARPCPHAVAATLGRARAARMRGDVRERIALLRGVCRDDPDEPGFRLQLADALAASPDARERAEAATILRELADNADVSSSLRGRALDDLASSAATAGDLASARALLQRALGLGVDADLHRQLRAQLFAFDHQGPAGAALRAFFTLPGSWRAWAELAVATEPELGLAHYLLGLNRARLGKTEADARAGAGELARALALGLPGPEFARTAARELLLAAYRAHDNVAVGAAIAVLAGPDMAETDHLLARDWSDRLAFDASYSTSR